MIRARPRHLFSWSFDLLLEDGSPVCLDMAWLREGGRFVWAGTEYQMWRRGFWASEFALEVCGQVMAVARKDFLARRFVVRLADREMELRARWWFSRWFELVEQGAVVGEVGPESLFGRSCTAQFPQDLSAPVQVFLFWLVILTWRRQNSAAAASSG